LTIEIEPVRPGEEATRGERPTVTIMASVLQGRSGQVFSPWVIVDDGDGALRSRERIVIELIILGISKVYL